MHELAKPPFAIVARHHYKDICIYMLYTLFSASHVGSSFAQAVTEQASALSAK